MFDKKIGHTFKLRVDFSIHRIMPPADDRQTR